MTQDSQQRHSGWDGPARELLWGGLLGLLLVLLVALFTTTPDATLVPRRTPDGPPPARRPVGDIAVEDRIVELPEDDDVWHTTVCVHAEWQTLKTDRELVAAFETDPRLVSLKAQTKWHLYTDADPFYRQRFAKHVPTLPAVLLQRGNGEVIFKATAANIDPPSLGGQLVTQIQQYRCDNGYCQPVQPQPTPIFDPPPWQKFPHWAEPIPDVLPYGGWFGFLNWIRDGRVWAVIAVVVGLVAWNALRSGAARPRIVYRQRRRRKAR